ncbi:MAG: hypothetical protein GF311_27685 [Candidatus Lokiarchaeota archaeon]|nr:hypothetical protein [Candidatus Lokiarchaeota archaeon]
MEIPEVNAIEGDYLQTKRDNLFFDVKGLRHPKDRIISFVRFHPDPEGDRQRDNIRYKKIYDIEERYKFLTQYYPQYLFFSKQFDMQIQGVKKSDIKKVYTPREYLNRLKGRSNLEGIEKDSYDLCMLLIEEGNLAPDSIGITGSQMIDLNKEESDIDLVIYGTDTSQNFQKTLPAIYEGENGCRRYTFDEYKSHYKFRAGGSGVSFNDFMKSERRKLHQGFYRGTEFFIRYIKSPKDWEDSYIDNQYKNLGRIRLMAEISEASDSIFTPASYQLNVLRILNLSLTQKDIYLDELDLELIRTINSYRGRFCEHAKEGELVMAEGKLEKVIYKDQEAYYRVLLGNEKTDKMILIS